MKAKLHLFDGRITGWQQALVSLWALILVGIVALWALHGVTMLTSGDLSEMFISIGDIFGLLATYFALTQFLLMGRIPWIERAFGLDRLNSYHRINGYLAISLIVIHPIFITFHHMAEDQTDYVHAYLSIFSEHPYTVWALIAELLFIAVVVSSMYIARKRLKFETWYYVHLMVYLAIILVPFHQFVNGATFAGSHFATNVWLALYAFVALNILVFRFGMVVFDAMKYHFEVSRVERETPTTVSVYIKARSLSRFHVKPGQFILVRFLTKRLIFQEHPFTVSWIPHGDELRITVRNSGDFTAHMDQIKPGTRVAVSGPFGRFTSDVAMTKKRLFIAGGVGITPLRCLAEEAASAETDAVLLYSNRSPEDVPLKSEIDELNLKTIYIYSDEHVRGAENGRLDGERIETLVPDYKSRDIYLCGPPPMTNALIAQLTELGVDEEQLHYERFALPG